VTVCLIAVFDAREFPVTLIPEGKMRFAAGKTTCFSNADFPSSRVLNFEVSRSGDRGGTRMVARARKRLQTRLLTLSRGAEKSPMHWFEMCY
jgi:hypothetical protein